MPIAYEILPEDRLVLTIWHGEVTLDEWEAHLAALLVDPALDSTGLHLVDVRSGDPRNGDSRRRGRNDPRFAATEPGSHSGPKGRGSLR